MVYCPVALLCVSIRKLSCAKRPPLTLTMTTKWTDLSGAGFTLDLPNTKAQTLPSLSSELQWAQEGGALPPDPVSHLQKQVRDCLQSRVIGSGSLCPWQGAQNTQLVSCLRLPFFAVTRDPVNMAGGTAGVGANPRAEESPRRCLGPAQGSRAHSLDLCLPKEAAVPVLSYLVGEHDNSLLTSSVSRKL